MNPAIDMGGPHDVFVTRLCDRAIFQVQRSTADAEGGYMVTRFRDPRPRTWYYQNWRAATNALERLAELR